MLIDTFDLGQWFCLNGPVQFDDEDPDDGDLYDVQKKLRMSRVSRRWRRVALQNSCLWARFRVGVGPKVYPALVAAFLERSGTAPLDVILYMDTENQDPKMYRVHPPALYSAIIALLVRHTARIRSLRLKCWGTVDLLDPLLNMDLDFSALRELRIARNFERAPFSFGDD
ncbi:hypothetical protein AURDEDRAFT_170444, partial [Auricularia subglabra TFB-10046 SS5]